LSLCPLFGAPAHSSHTKKPKKIRPMCILFMPMSQRMTFF